MSIVVIILRFDDGDPRDVIIVVFDPLFGNYEVLMGSYNVFEWNTYLCAYVFRINIQYSEDCVSDSIQITEVKLAR